MQTDELSQFSKLGEKSLNQVNLILAKPSIPQHYEAKPDIASMTNGAIFLIPICFMMIWTVFVFMSSDIWIVGRKKTPNVKDYYRVPCKNCRFFTNNPYLKCAVNPSLTLTPQAINCSDYSSKTESFELDSGKE